MIDKVKEERRERETEKKIERKKRERNGKECRKNGRGIERELGGVGDDIRG